MNTKIKLKESQYNFKVKLKSDNTIVFNAVSKAVGKFKSQQFKVVKYIFSNPNVPVSSFNNGFAIKSYLMKNGFLVSDILDEFELLKKRNLFGKNEKHAFDLFILPTLDCNFRCFYCYEEHQAVSMASEVETRIKKWGEQTLKEYNILNLSWFGGEPLLEIDTIARVSGFFQTLCAHQKKQFTNMITTNGYLLTRDNIKILKDAGIKHFHVTLDGSSQWHDKFRVHKTKGATYSRIAKGILHLLDAIQDVKITIRVNYNKNSFDNIPELFSVFPFQRRKQIYLIFRQIFGKHSDTSPLPEKSRRELEFYKEAAEKGYRLSLAETLLGPKETYCYADKKGSLVIGPNAELFPCGVSKFDHKSKMGDLNSDGKIEWKTNMLKAWIAVDGFDDPDCKKCRYMPLCMGGCRANRLHQKDKGHCTQPFELLHEMLTLSNLESPDL